MRQVVAVSSSEQSCSSRPAINSFGYATPAMSDIIRDPLVLRLASDILANECEVICGKSPARLDVLLSRLAGRANSSAIAELRNEIAGGDVGLNRARRQRVDDLVGTFRRVVGRSGYRPFGKLLDLGCGHGLVAKSIARDFNGVEDVRLADVFDYRDPSAQVLPFDVLTDGARLPYPDRSFDSVLILTVLHHSLDPEHLLREAVRVCRGLVFIMESLVGVTPPFDSQKAECSGVTSAHERFSSYERRFTELTFAQQVMHASLQDWFYNCVIQGEVDVPMNFGRDRDWRRLFSFLGLSLAYSELVGYDQITAPEYHSVYICAV